MLMHTAFISFCNYIVEAVHDELADLRIPQINYFNVRISQLCNRLAVVDCLTILLALDS